MASDGEWSKGGSKILRHEVPAERHSDVAEVDDETLAAIDRHLRTFVGAPKTVFHELISDVVHIDVHIIEPSEERPCYTLVTTGMSALPMTTPPGVEGYEYTELMLSLPADWAPGPLVETELGVEALYWPLRLLKGLARLPHSYNTWLSYGHTIPNGNPPKPYAPNTELCCALILPPLGVTPDFHELEVRPDKVIRFWAVVPIYESEMTFKLEKGADALLDAMLEASVTELIDPKRPPAVKKKRFLFF